VVSVALAGRVKENEFLPGSKHCCWSCEQEQRTKEFGEIRFGSHTRPRLGFPVPIKAPTGVSKKRSALKLPQLRYHTVQRFAARPKTEQRGGGSLQSPR
jgi:hypothetical protein